MYNFKNDYCMLCSYKILEALNKYKDEVCDGYGLDIHSQNAEKLIKEKFKLNNNSKVFFVTGGTQANMLVISYMLRPYEAVIAADSGHINVHETGAIENAGHKILTAKNKDGKLNYQDIIDILNDHTDEHKVKPKMVYISFSTESGTIYSKKEIEDIARTCHEHNLYLFIDGARLASGICSKYNDLKLEDFGKYADFFYIGGTKNGLMSGEAIVFKDGNLASDFRYYIKQKGAMLVKGFVVGIQFERLFEDDLYLEIGNNANNMAYYLTENLEKLGFKMQYVTQTNQVFVLCDNKIADKMISKYDVALWETINNNKVIRFVCSYATTKNDCDELINYFKEVMNA